MAYISLRNTGNCAWQAGTQLQYESGALLQAPEAINLNALIPGDTLQIHMALSAPLEFGTYTSVWQVRQPDGVTLGNSVKIEIVVEDLPTATPKPFPTAAPAEATPLPLAAAPPVLEEWENIPDSLLWQGTVHFQATGGTGSYRFYQNAVREETTIDNGKITVSAQRCAPLSLDIWVVSGIEVDHWQGNLPYPEPEACE